MGTFVTIQMLVGRNSGYRASKIVGMKAGFQCAGCGEWNETSVDESAGRTQLYVEDCQVCCKANVMHVEFDLEEEQYVIQPTWNSYGSRTQRWRWDNERIHRSPAHGGPQHGHYAV